MSALVEVRCYRCKEPFGLLRESYDTLQRNHATFHCPWGHQQHFVEGETEAERLRRERDHLRQRLAYKDDRIREVEAERDHQRHRANGYKGHATRITKRAKAGVCPCCNRSFENLRRHMASQHPQFSPLEEEKDAA